MSSDLRRPKPTSVGEGRSLGEGEQASARCHRRHNGTTAVKPWGSTAVQSFMPDFPIQPPKPLAFIADVMLGRLARWLRILGSSANRGNFLQSHRLALSLLITARSDSNASSQPNAPF
jgi:hypothetical protein